MKYQSGASNLTSKISPLANRFDIEQAGESYLSMAVRAVSTILRSKGVNHIDYTKFKVDSSEPLKNFLDNNNLTYREVNLESYDFKTTIPSTIGCTDDDYICIFEHDEKMVFYSAKNNCYISDIEAGKQKISNAFELYGSLKDSNINIFEIFAFTFNGQVRRIILLMFVALFTTCLYLLLPLFTGPLTDVIIPYSEVGLLINCSLGFLLVIGISSFSVFIQNLLLIKLETITDLSLQVALWDRLIKLPLTLISQFNTGDLNSRVDAITKIRDILTAAVLQSFLASIFTVLYLIVMLISAPIATLLCLPVVGLLIGGLALIIYQKFKLQLQVYQKEADTLNFALQAVLNITPFKSAGRELNLIYKWLGEIKGLAVINLKSQSWEDAARYVVSFARSLSLSVLFFYIYFRLNLYPSQVLSSKLTEITGSYITFLVAFEGLLTGISQITLLFGSSLSEVYVQWHRAKPLLASAIDDGYSQSSTVHNLQEAIIFDGIAYRYKEGFSNIFNELSVKFEMGKYTAITGKSGCGKSTLIRLLLGLEEPTAGKILIDHVDIKKINIRSYRRDIGVVMQDLSLFPASIFKNMCGGLEYSEDQVWHALEQAKIADEVHAMPMKLHTVLANGGSSLSGGQQQRLCIARALISQPKILLLDEATSALDPKQQEELLGDLIDQKVTLISVAHRLSTIKSADVIYKIEGGKAKIHGQN